MSATTSPRSAIPLTPLRTGPVATDLQRGPLERVGADDQFHDYVLGAYEPLVPAAGKLRSLNLLRESFALAGLEDAGRAVIDVLRAGLGPFRTVWGVKRHHDTGALGWELYFYDFERRHADLSIARVVELLGPALRVDAREPFTLPWHMFSVECGAAHLTGGVAAAVDVYLDMRSYKLRGDRLAFENVYTFHDPRSEIDDVLHRLDSSVHFSRRRDELAALLPPYLFRCGRLCVANKQRADALYASRIPTPSLRRFLAAHEWPTPLQAFVDRHAADLDHLLWDVGLDFDGVEGTPRVRKTGIYGSF